MSGGWEWEVEEEQSETLSPGKIIKDDICSSVKLLAERSIANLFMSECP